jgi:F-type H+-transporting ATPase subunit b
VLIDWFTVVAQVINFLILVWLLKHFLYKPILDAIDAREKRIAKELADAAAKKTEAQKEFDEFRRKNEEFEQQRDVLLSKATEEAQTERQRLLDEARQAADVLLAKRQQALRNDAHNLHQELSRLTQQEVFSIARKALADLTDTGLEERIVEAFMRRLREMDEQSKAGLAQALKTASEPALVRSAFDLPEQQRATIQNALNETFSAAPSTLLRTGISIRFETAPNLISGIELIANGQKVAWSIADYLVSLDKAVNDLLKQQNDKADADTQAKARSDLNTQIGKRAYEIYETQGRQDGQAATNWETAEREIRQEKYPAKVEPKLKAKAVLKPEAKAAPEAEVKAEPKPEANTAPEPEATEVPKPEVKTKAAPKTEAIATPKPEVKAEPESEDPKPTPKSQ